MRNKKAQEEIVGFVMVVVVVAVILVIFLGIMIRKPAVNESNKNSEVRHFLSSVMQMTTSCSLNSERDYRDVGSLISTCYNEPQKRCFNSENSVCVELNSTLIGVAESWNVYSNGAIKGYELDVEHQKKDKGRERMLNLFKGNCSNNYIADSEFIPDTKSGGSFEVSMKLCF